jgi:myo-inositol-1(or 4)-monophosphatase
MTCNSQRTPASFHWQAGNCFLPRHPEKHRRIKYPETTGNNPDIKLPYLRPVDAKKLNAVIAIVKSCGQRLLERQQSLQDLQVRDKGLNQLVSEADVEAENALVHGLGKLIPEAAFITEEGTVAQGDGAGLAWIIDPLDGTTNFLHGLPMFSVSVALAKGNELLAGIVYVPALDECFHAVKGGGGFLNNQAIQVSQAAGLPQSLLATGFPYTDFEGTDAYLNVLRSFMQQTRGLRRMGSAAIDLAYTACGRFEGFFEYGLAPWDVAAGALLVQEAGGLLSDFRGGDHYLFGKEIIAAAPAVHAPMRSAIQEEFGR